MVGGIEKAAQAKVEIAHGLTELVRAAQGMVEGSIQARSSRWWYNTDSLSVLAEETELEISLGAKHRLKATWGIPCAGILSELVVNIFTYSNVVKFMESDLAQEMKKYLNQYGDGQ